MVFIDLIIKWIKICLNALKLCNNSINLKTRASYNRVRKERFCKLHAPNTYCFIQKQNELILISLEAFAFENF